MEFPLIVLIALLPRITLAAPVMDLASSVAVATSSTGQGGTSSSFAQSFARSSSHSVAEAQGRASGNPFLNGQFESLSASSAGSISKSNPSSLTEDSAPAESLGSGNAAAAAYVSGSGAIDAVQNANSNAAADLNLNSNANFNSNANRNAGYFANQFAGTNSNANAQDLGSAQVQGSGAVSSAGGNQNQGSNGIAGIANLGGRIVHYAQSGPVVHIVTADNANNVEVSGNNQGSGSSNSAGTVENLGAVESQTDKGLANFGSPLPSQSQQIIGVETSPLNVHNANASPVTLAGVANVGVNNGVYPGAWYASNGAGRPYQNAIIQNSSFMSSSSSSHSESHQSSSSSNSSNSSYNFATVA